MNKNITKLIIIFFICSWVKSFAQIRLEKSFNWSAEPEKVAVKGNVFDRWSFDEGIVHATLPSLTYARWRLPVPGSGKLEVQIIDAQFEPFRWSPRSSDVEKLSADLDFVTNVTKHRNQYFGNISLVPIIKDGNSYKRLKSITFEVNQSSQPIIQLRGPDDVTVSALNDGDIYKIGIETPGIHKITYDFLQNELAIDIDQIDPRTIKILGDRGGMLPTNIASPRVEDLEELPIKIIGEDDGRFDASDYLLFFAEGPSEWIYDADLQLFNQEKNIYDNKNYYFLKISAGEGQRVSEQNSLSSTAYRTNSYNDFANFEEDDKNMMHDWNRTQGSGQEWFGSYFRNQRAYSFDDLFDFPGLISSDPVRVSARMALRATTRSSFQLTLNGTRLESTQASSVSDLSDSETTLFHYSTIQAQPVNVNNERFSFEINYPFPRGK